MSEHNPEQLAILSNRIALLTVAVLVGVAVGATAATAGEAPGDDEMIQLSEEVSVWSESTYAVTQKHPDETTELESPLVASVPTRQVEGTYSNGATVEGVANDPAATAVDPGSLLQFTFWSEKGADTEQFAGTETSLVVAELDNSSDPAVDGAAELSAERAADLLVAEDRNDRAEFETEFTDESEHPPRVVNDDGYFASYYGLDNETDSGVYVLYVVETVEGDGVTVDGGDLSVDGEINVLGIDSVAVHDDSSTVETSGEHAVGERVEFDVTASGETVDHTVALFDESALAEEELTVSSDQDIDSGLTPEELSVESSAAIEGVADVEDATVFGSSVADGPAAQRSEIGVVTSYIATAEPNASGPAGSITARTDLSGSETVGVETDADWAAGEYTYVHVATAADGTTTTTRGTITLQASETGEMNNSSAMNESNETDNSSEETNSDTPGFGIVVAVSALLAVVFGARRRAQN